MKRLLIVEKEPRVRQLIRVNLERVGGYDITEASDGESAWQLLQQESFDLAIMEVLLPPINGEGLLEVMERSERTATMTVIVMLWVPTDRRLSDFFSDYQARHPRGRMVLIMKPFNPSDLKKMVGQILTEDTTLN